MHPDSDLHAIAVEGLSPADAPLVSADASEVADCTFYYGDSAGRFESSSAVVVAQFKYSLTNTRPVRAADTSSTLAKFATSLRELSAIHGSESTRSKLSFQYITNRPIHPRLQEALSALASESLTQGDTATQAKQIRSAIGLSDKETTWFASSLTLIGSTLDLRANKRALASQLVNWSMSPGPEASARLGRVRDLVRNKAGSDGAHNNVIQRTDVLAALEVDGEDDLLPCPPYIDTPDYTQPRKQSAEAAELVRHSKHPLLVHAGGGVGKTVFLQEIASELADSHEAVLFDCFAGGSYRVREDARHLPRRGLLHIINTLAFRSLCDPALPGNQDGPTMLRAARRRLEQCVDTLAQQFKPQRLLVGLDAIDNAQIAADEQHEECFAVSFVESVARNPIPGVSVVATCRTERIPETLRGVPAMQLDPLSQAETGALLAHCAPHITENQRIAAWARSQGNPRVLRHLIDSGRLDEPQANDEPIVLDDLLRKRIQSAIRAAGDHGHRDEDLHSFLCGLASLPPPIPISPLADALGITAVASASLAADLHGLLDRTSHGLIFRDEPTETLVRDAYAKADLIRQLAERLWGQQHRSTYAALALPGLLLQVRDAESLFSLALDDTPLEFSETSERKTRLARLTAAATLAASTKDLTRLGTLLVELATHAHTDAAGSKLICDYPDLAALTRDPDVIRVLFKQRTDWPASRNARLCVAYAISGDRAEASWHWEATKAWLRHYRSGDNRVPRLHPEPSDVAAAALLPLLRGDTAQAAEELSHWTDGFAHDACENVLGYLVAACDKVESSFLTRRLAATVEGIGATTAALAGTDHTKAQRIRLVNQLAHLCATDEAVAEIHHDGQSGSLHLGIAKAVALASSLGKEREAHMIAKCISRRRPSLWQFDGLISEDVFSFLFLAALGQGRTGDLSPMDVLPSELSRLCTRLEWTGSIKQFIARAIARLGNLERHNAKQRPHMRHDHREHGERFLRTLLEGVLSLTRLFATVLWSRTGSASRAFGSLCSYWEELCAERTRDTPDYHLFRRLGLSALIFLTWSRSDLRTDSVGKFLAAAKKLNVPYWDLGRISMALSRRERLAGLAGEACVQAMADIETENDSYVRAHASAKLARSILASSTDEAVEYFRGGLAQASAIGSGDGSLVNALIGYLSYYEGEELPDELLHAIANLCEINFGDEPSAFDWHTFGAYLSRCAGVNGLARLSRWADRDIAPLDYTLLPSLTGMIRQGVIHAADAVALSKLVSQSNSMRMSIQRFGEALTNLPCGENLAAEAVSDFERQYAHLATEDDFAPFLALAARAGPDLLGRLTRRSNRQSDAFDELRAQETHGLVRSDAESEPDSPANPVTTKPNGAAALESMIQHFFDGENRYFEKEAFFTSLRKMIPFRDRGMYIRTVALVPHLSLHWILDELEAARDAWASSSSSLTADYRSIAQSLLRSRSYDFLTFDRLATEELNRLADLCNSKASDVACTLIQILLSTPIPGSIWLGLASTISAEANSWDATRAVVSRLLRSKKLSLADSAADGPWDGRVTPPAAYEECLAEFTWRSLGSADVRKRWRAAHCVRSLAENGRVAIIDSLVKLASQPVTKPGAGSAFQVHDAPFFHLDAVSWLLIALARVSLDHPHIVLRHQEWLLHTCQDQEHVMIRHFAAFALVSCGTEHVASVVDLANKSPFEEIRGETTDRGDFYRRRPTAAPARKEFRYDYDFDKEEIGRLARLFGLPHWKAQDACTEAIYEIDGQARAMSESPGRPASQSRLGRRHDDPVSTYGEYLARNGLLIAAGRLLKERPVVADQWTDGDAWATWMSQHTIARPDGYWLADGTDSQPITTIINLRTKDTSDYRVTHDTDRIWDILHDKGSQGVVVSGSWRSPDSVRVNIDSALCAAKEEAELVHELATEGPTRAWLPSFQHCVGEDDQEVPLEGRLGFQPWIAYPSLFYSTCDEQDPLAAPGANRRPILSRAIRNDFSLQIGDSMMRTWITSSGDLASTSSLWIQEDRAPRYRTRSSNRLVCSSDFIYDVLASRSASLMVLVNLEYEAESGPSQRVIWLLAVRPDCSQRLTPLASSVER